MKHELKTVRADKSSFYQSNKMISLLMTAFLLILGALSLTVLLNSPA